MIEGKRIIAVIPARGGSKSVPDKNIRHLGGKPLIAWAIQVAKSVGEIDRVIVSTDDMLIEAEAHNYGAEVYHRPDELATDQALVVDALRDLIGKLSREGENGQIMLLLEPTCPFRTAEDIRRCLFKLVENDLDSVATFKLAELNPHRAWRLGDEGPEPFLVEADPWLPRQELPTAYQLNGAVYAFVSEKFPRVNTGLLFGKNGAILMPPERSIDIDSELDIVMAEMMLEKLRLCNE